MKYLSLIIVAILSGCASEMPTPVAPEFGWRSAGLVLPDAYSTGGLHKMVNIGNDIFVMDAYTPKVKDQWNPPSRTNHWRIWKGRVGSMNWDTLPVPNGQCPKEWVVANGKLYVGTRYDGDVWEFDPKTNEWAKIPLPEKPGLPDSLYDVRSMTTYKGELVVGIDVNATSRHINWMGGIVDKVGRSIPGVNGVRPLNDMLEFGDYLYGIDAQIGIYRYMAGAAAWESLPSARGRAKSSQNEDVSALGVHGGHLYVGYANFEDGLFRWNGDGTWRNMTPRSDSLKYTEAPRDIRVITSYGGDLFMAGSASSSVRRYVPQDTNVSRYGDWRLVDSGWCRYDSYGCGYDVRGLIGIGDTLYATAWGFVAKVPISELKAMEKGVYKWF